MEDLIKALQIFLKYSKDWYPTNCSHDVLRLYVDPEIVSDKDKVELEDLGFIIDEDEECFMSFRFGSC